MTARAAGTPTRLVRSNALFCAALFRAISRIPLPSPSCPLIRKPTPETRPPVGGAPRLTGFADSSLARLALLMGVRFLEANRSPQRA